MDLQGSAAETLLYTRDMLVFQVRSKSEPISTPVSLSSLGAPTITHCITTIVVSLYYCLPHITLQY